MSLYTQIHGRISGYIGRERITYRPSYVSDGVNHRISTTRLEAPSHNTSATSTCLSPRGLTISGCPTFKQPKLSHPHNNAKRRENEALLALTVFYQCADFISMCALEPTTRLVFLGIICDTEARRFEIPKGKLLKLEVILAAAITCWRISFVDLERFGGKCTSMSVAVLPASLYTYHMYVQTHIEVPRTGGELKQP